MLVKGWYNRPKIFFALVHTPSIYLDQDRSDVNNSARYLNVGTDFTFCKNAVVLQQTGNQGASLDLFVYMLGQTGWMLLPPQQLSSLIVTTPTF